MSVSLQARRSASAATKPATYTGTLARSFVTSCAHQRAGSDRPQALHSTSDAEDSPANPSPPPRATASTPQPGSKSFQNSGAPSGGVARRSSKPPGPGAPSALTTGISGKILAFLGLGKEQIGAMRTTRDLYEECAAIWDLDRDFWQGGEFFLRSWACSCLTADSQTFCLLPRTLQNATCQILINRGSQSPTFTSPSC